MPDALVSVIVPVLDGERFLGAALDSVGAQTYPHVEIIVIDEGSSDRSVEIVAKRPAVRLLRQGRAGVAAARNAGAEEARGELIAFLDQDDEWRPDKLECQVALLGERPDIAIALTHIEVVLEAGTPLPEWVLRDWLTTPQRGYIPSTWLVRREAFEQIGPFDTSYAMAADGDWLARAKDAGLSSEMLAGALVRWRIHGANHSFDQETMRRELLRLLLSSSRRQREAGHAA
jgi:glycosyltransferase involved in cell wall biosynthesis